MKEISRKLLSLIIVFLIAITAFPIAVLASEENLNTSIINIPSTAQKFGDSYYQVYFDSSIGWHDAKAVCEDLGGHLATISNKEENDFIYSLVRNAGIQCWLGATDEENEGIWEWVTGEPWLFNNARFDNCAGIQHYLVLNYNSNSTWDDQSEKAESNGGQYCKTGGYICEWDLGYSIVGRNFNKNLDYYAENLASSSYDPELANMMAALSKAVYSESNINSACESLGFETYGVYDFGSNYNPLTCGYSMAFKKSNYSDDFICLISVRGSKWLDYNADWIGNCYIDSENSGDEKHPGFARPADRIYEEIQTYIKSNNITENVNYFITGHSRGAAVANLLSVKLMENGVSSANVYDYNFACPDVACKEVFPNYDNVFNFCNREDIVPFLPGKVCSAFTSSGTAWGKFGKIYWFVKEAPNKVNPFSGHDMDLYLEFFDQKPDSNDWWSPSWEEFLSEFIIGWVVKTFCPVDLIITDQDGNKIASVIDGELNYYDSKVGDVIVFTDGDKKVIYINGDKNFNVNLVGTDSGEMTYSVEKYNVQTEEVLESKTFINVQLENGKQMYSPVNDAETANDIELFVIENEDGQNVITHVVNVDGTEKRVSSKGKISIKNNTGSKSINYGETLKLTAIVTDKPDYATIVWYVDGVEKGEGETFDFSILSGSAEVSVKLVYENGEVLTDLNGDEISDSETVSVNASFWQKIVSFFKNLFRISRMIIQSV